MNITTALDLLTQAPVIVGAVAGALATVLQQVRIIRREVALDTVVAAVEDQAAFGKTAASVKEAVASYAYNGTAPIIDRAVHRVTNKKPTRKPRR